MTVGFLSPRSSPLKLLKNGNAVLKAKCGKFNISGCMGDQQDTGVVYDVKLNILS